MEVEEAINTDLGLGSLAQRNYNDDKNEKNQNKSWKTNWFNKQNKNCENAAHFLADFFAVITQLTLSNLIGMAIVWSLL